MKEFKPNFKLIFSDIIDKKYPDKKKSCENILQKDTLTTFDIIKLNEIIFEKKDIQTEIFNQKHRSYNTSDILQILQYQKNNKLNNTQVSLYFKLSRNTVAKWKKFFLV